MVKGHWIETWPGCPHYLLIAHAIPQAKEDDFRSEFGTEFSFFSSLSFPFSSVTVAAAAAGVTK